MEKADLPNILVKISYIDKEYIEILTISFIVWKRT